LDSQRLGKQRLEAKEVLDLVLKRTVKKGWMKHPIARMWQPYAEFLKKYFNMCVAEWISRGYVNNMDLEVVDEAKIVIPAWWGDEELHGSHRANLLRKNPEYYGEFKWTENPRNGYLWMIPKDDAASNFERRSIIHSEEDTKKWEEKKKAKKEAKLRENRKRKEAAKKQQTTVPYTKRRKLSEIES